MLVSYTYSKSLDNGGEQLVGDLSLRNVNNVDQEYGLSTGDMRHRFVASVLYDLPFGHGRRFDIVNPVLNAVAGGWQVNTIVTVHSGQPFTPSLGVSSANTGAARPSVLRDGNLPSDQRTVQNWFDKTAFYSPAQYLTAMPAAIFSLRRAQPTWTSAPSRVFHSPRSEKVRSCKFAPSFSISSIIRSSEYQTAAWTSRRARRSQRSRLPMRQMQFGVKLLF